ncbi:MAG: hypothetical protein Q8O99_03010 [bacterium]|nr:hypothetical protein [bacterium]
MIPDALIYKDSRNLQEWVQAIFLVQEKQPITLLAQASSTALPPAATCSLSSEGFTSTGQLYDEVKPIVGDAYSEDVGRYVGYGRKGGSNDQRRGIKPFIDPRWADLFGWDE